MLVNLERTCPLCNGGQGRLIHQQRFSPIVGVSVLEGYDVVTCNLCGFGFADKIPSQAGLDTYYQGQSKYEDEKPGEQEGREHGFRLVAEALATLEESRDTPILDVGCSTGEFLAHLRNVGFRSLRGLDPSPRCAQLARERFGVDVMTGSVMSPPSGIGRHGVVLLLAVLEHLADLDRAICETAQLVAEGGLLFVEVPDATRFDEGENAPFQEFSVEHINYFSQTSVDRLVSRVGFRRVWSATWRERGPGNTTTATLACAYRRGKARVGERDEETESGLRRYEAACRRSAEELQAAVRGLATLGRPFLVWGAGTLTQRLLATGAFKNLDVIGFVDSDVHYRGRLLAGRPIMSPAEIVGRDEPIVVASRGYQRAICRQIRETMNLSNEVVTLFPE
jgi:SAM-dependent methyltransferase